MVNRLTVFCVIFILVNNCLAMHDSGNVSRYSLLSADNDLLCDQFDLSDQQPIDAAGAVALDHRYGVIGNQIIARRGNYWVRDVKLPVVNDSFGGESVDIRQGYVIIGNSGENKASVFRRDRKNGSWNMAAEFVEPDLRYFGESVYIDRHRAMVSAPWSDMVVVYQREESTWRETFRIQPDETGIDFGASIDVVGNILFVGAEKADRVYIYKFRQGEWELIQILDQSDPQRSTTKQFGWSIDAHGNELAVGAYQDGEHIEGQVYIYTRTGDFWHHKQTLRAFPADEENSGDFGHNLAMNATQLFVGDDAREKIYAFTREAGFWVEREVISRPVGAPSDFGYYLAVNDHHLLTGGDSPFLFGPAIRRHAVNGRVVDADNTTLYLATIPGPLADIQTNEQGEYNIEVPHGWRGNLSAQYRGWESNTVGVDIVREDTTVPDLVIPEVFTHHLYIGIPRAVNPITLEITGIGEIEFTPPSVTLELPNHWQGTIRPVSDYYTFTPSEVEVEDLIYRDTILFRHFPTANAAAENNH